MHFLQRLSLTVMISLTLFTGCVAFSPTEMKRVAKIEDVVLNVFVEMNEQDWENFVIDFTKENEMRKFLMRVRKFKLTSNIHATPVSQMMLLDLTKDTAAVGLPVNFSYWTKGSAKFNYVQNIQFDLVWSDERWKIKRIRPLK